MPLADLTQLKLHLSITATTQDDLLQQLLDQADRTVRSYTDRRLEQATYTDYYSGTGNVELLLREYPVKSVASVYLDSAGYFGRGSGAFAATTLLTAGRDYALALDGDNGEDDDIGSASGMLTRVGMGGAFAGIYGRYSLAAGYLPSVWPVGQGNVKVTYTAGYDPVPQDLSLAAMQLAATVYKTRLNGGLRLGSESLGRYSFSLLAGSTNAGPDGEMGGVRQLLAPYVRRKF